MVKRGLYYHIVEHSGSCKHEPCSKYIARCDSISTPKEGGFWVVLVDLEGSSSGLYVPTQKDLSMEVIPVSKAFNRYLKLFE